MKVVATSKFFDDYESFSRGYSISEKLSKFISAKVSKPNALIGAKDYVFSNGDLRTFYHYHLVHGEVILIYKIKDEYLRLYRLVKHKMIDGVPPKSFTNYLNSVSDFFPFHISKKALQLNSKQEKILKDQIFELAATHPNTLTGFIKGTSSELIDIFRIALEITDDVSTENLQDAIYAAFGGTEKFVAYVKSVMRSIGLRESKTAPLKSLLESRFGLTVDTVDVNHLEDLVRHYGERRAMLISEMGEGPALQSPDYQKAVLISETARMILKEIRPKRTKRRGKVNEGMFGEIQGRYASTTVHKIKTRRELDFLLDKHGALRAFLDDALYVWNAEDAAHMDAANSLGLDGVRLMISGHDPYQIEYNVYDTDPEEIANEPVIRALFKPEEIEAFRFTANEV